MQGIRIRSYGRCWAALMSAVIFLLSVPVTADDTEIYFSSAASDKSSAPSLIFMIPNSKFMDDATGLGVPSCGSTYSQLNGDTRFNHMRCAMVRALKGDETYGQIPDNIRVGLAYLKTIGSAKGGYIGFPAMPLGDMVEVQRTVTSTTAGGTTTQSQAVANTFNSAYGWNSTSATSASTLTSVNSTSLANVAHSFRFGSVQTSAMDRATLSITFKSPSNAISRNVAFRVYGLHPTVTVPGAYPSAKVSPSYVSGSIASIARNSAATATVDITSLLNDQITQSGADGLSIPRFMVQVTAYGVAASSMLINSAKPSLSVSKTVTVTLPPTETTTTVTQTITVREKLVDDLLALGMPDVGNPSFGEGYLEAGLYTMGKLFYGGAEAEAKVTALDTSYTAAFNYNNTTQGRKVYDLMASNSTTYRSPVSTVGQCSGNYILTIADGETGQASTNSLAAGLIGKACDVSGALFTGSQTSVWGCVASGAKYLQDTSANTAHVKVNSSFINIIPSNYVASGSEPTYASSSHNLRTAAQYGGGQYYDAGDESSFVKAIQDTLSRVLTDSASLSAPGVAVNQLNRFTFLSQIFFSVFKPDDNANSWSGNIKRFKIKDIASSNPMIVGVDNNNAIDPLTFYFSSAAQSFWTPSAELPDGPDVTQGGVASTLLPSSSLMVRTFNPSTLASETVNSTMASNSPERFGVTSSDEAQKVVNWLHGYEADGSTSNRWVADPLHAQPMLVNYGYDTSVSAVDAANDPDKQYNILYFSDNAGVLRAINTQNGAWKGLWLPNRFLSVVAGLQKNVLGLSTYSGTSSAGHQYGLDSNWTVWRVDGDKDSQITANDPDDYVYLYAGMRMGGDNYYALDATRAWSDGSIDLLWRIAGGSGDYANMGQTWSQPNRTRVKINGVVQDVLVFGGGYDPDNERAGVLAQDSKGMQVYIVSAKPSSSGSKAPTLYWWGSSEGSATTSHALMKYSVTGKVRALDVNGDMMADFLYWVDLGGQIMRADLVTSNTGTSTLVKRIVRLACLGECEATPTVAGQRRFYDAPDVAVSMNPQTGERFVAVAVGSGYRGHPLNTQTSDRLYVLKDKDALRTDLLTLVSPSALLTGDASDGSDSLTETDFIDLTTNIAPTSAELQAKKGWMIQLTTSGEKSLSTPLIFNGLVFFTTYVPNDGSSSTQCAPTVGNTYLWWVNLFSGAPTYDANGDGTINSTADRKKKVANGLAGTPQVVVGEDDTATSAGNSTDSCSSGSQIGSSVIVGTSINQGGTLGCASVTRVKWYEKPR